MFVIYYQLLFVITGIIISYLIFKKACRRALFTTIGMTALFYLLSTKIVALILIQPLIIKQKESFASAIIVLGSNNEEDRILKGLSLAQEKNLPVIFSGIRSDSIKMIDKFNDIETIFEKNSSTTYEHAIYTKPLLWPIKAERIYLVTSQEHLLRAKLVFEKLDIQVVPIASRLISRNINIMSFAPKPKYYSINSSIIYEYLALLHYRLTKKI